MVGLVLLLAGSALTASVQAAPPPSPAPAEAAPASPPGKTAPPPASEPATPAAEAADAASEVIVVYSTLDPAAARPVFEMFTQRSGIEIRPVFQSDQPGRDTESLADRLKRERQAGQPQADLWWSANLLETLALAKTGAFRKYESEAAGRHAGPEADQWPAELREADGTWYGLARRLRVLIYNTDQVSALDLPPTLDELAQDRWKGKVGLAAPRRGSDSLTHLAAVHQAMGPEAFTVWLERLKSAEVQRFDSEADLVQAVAAGRAAIGLTSSDLAIQAAKSGQPIRFRVVTDRAILPRGARRDSTVVFEPGAAQLPGAVAVVEGGRSADLAEVLVDFLLSNEVAQVMERGPMATIRLGEAAHDSLLRWCDGATGPGRQPRILVELKGYSAKSLSERTLPAAEAWGRVWPEQAR